MPPLSWGLSSVPAAHPCPTVLMTVGLPCLGKTLLLQLNFCVLCSLPSYAVPWQYHLPQQSVNRVNIWHGFVMQQGGCLA